MKEKKFEKGLSLFVSLYLMLGLVFAFAFAIYYKWQVPFAYFSPGFFWVIFTWPFQAIGFINDLLYYGLAGKPV